MVSDKEVKHPCLLDTTGNVHLQPSLPSLQSTFTAVTSTNGILPPLRWTLTTVTSTTVSDESGKNIPVYWIRPAVHLQPSLPSLQSTFTSVTSVLVSHIEAKQPHLLDITAKVRRQPPLHSLWSTVTTVTSTTVSKKEAKHPHLLGTAGKVHLQPTPHPPVATPLPRVLINRPASVSSAGTHHVFVELWQAAVPQNVQVPQQVFRPGK